MLSIFIKLFVGVVFALVLFGVVGGVDFVYLIGALVLLRFWVLLKHWFRTPATQSDWDALRQVLGEQLEALDAEAAVEIRLELGLPVDASNEEVVAVSTQQAMEAYRPPRAKVELLCEFVGLLSYLLLAPFVFALFGLDFVALNLPLTWTAFFLILVCAVAYFVPFYVWKEANSIRSRCIWWCLPFVPLLLLSLYGVEVRHPYLNPMHPERHRIAAERVLAMSDIVSSGRHAGTVKRYGQVLEDAGEVREALAVYQFALLLNASDDALRSDVERISQELGIVERGVELEQTRFERRIFTGPIRTIDLGLELSELDEFTVVLVSVGAVSDRVKMKVAETIREELSVDVMMVGAELPLPEHTRRRGFVTGKQWEANAIIGAFWEAYPKLPVSPVKYLLLTPVDIYMPNSNYVFSGSMPWGALVSFARYGSSGDLLERRTAKQSLCALIKVFPIKPSTSRDCVTSYTRSLREFDQKGDSPSAAVLSEFHYHVNRLNQSWQQHKAGSAR